MPRDTHEEAAIKAVEKKIKTLDRRIELKLMGIQPLRDEKRAAEQYLEMLRERSTLVQ